MPRNCRLEMVKPMVGLLLFAALGALAGILETNDVAGIVNADGTAAPFVLGEGMLKYTGPSACYANDIALTNANANGVGASTIWVDDPATVLTLSGTVGQSAGAFIKAGDGTLRFTGAAQVGVKPAAKIDGAFAWGEDGAAATGYNYANILSGRVVVDGVGAGITWANMSYIGLSYPADAALDVVNGASFVQKAGWTCLNRGNSTSSDAYGAYMTVSNAATATMSQLVLNNSNGTSGYRGRARLLVADRSRATVGGAIFQTEGTGTGEIVVSNRSAFVNNAALGYDTDGWCIGVNGSSSVGRTVIQNCSTGLAHAVTIRAGSSLEVTGDSVFAMGRAVTKWGTNDANRTGNVYFDKSTLTTRTDHPAEWFRNHTNLFVGVNGITLAAPGYAALFPPIAPWNATAPGPIVKTGAGTLAMASVDYPMSVNAGTLRLSTSDLEVNAHRTSAIDFATRTRAEIAGEGSAGGLALGNAEAIVLESSGLEMRTNLWQCNAIARIGADRRLWLTDYMSSSSLNYSSAFFRRKVKVNASFALSYSMAGVHLGSGAANGGISVILQNAPAGLGAMSKSGQGNLGYMDANGGFKTNSFAVMIDLRSDKRCYRFGKNGASMGMYNPGGNSITVSDYLGGLEKPVACTLAYDAVAKRVTFTVRSKTDLARSDSYDVDLSELLGGDEAYFGFGAATEGLDTGTQFAISDVHVREAVDPVVRTGGRATTASALALRASDAQSGFVMDRLTFADGDTLKVGCDTNAVQSPIAPLTLANHDLWTLEGAGGAHWAGDVALGLSNQITLEDGTTKRLGGEAHSKSDYPLTGSWNLSFDFLLGNHSSVPADALAFGLVPGSASTTGQFVKQGLEVDLRYYINASPWVWTCVTMKNRGTSFLCETNDATAFNMGKESRVHVAMAYDDTEKTLDLTLTGEKTGSYAKHFDNFDMVTCLNGATHGNLRFYGTVGGSWSENIVSNLVFASAAITQATAPSTAYAAFDAYAGAGTLVKTGNASLGVLSTNAQAVALTLAEGGLVLAKEETEGIRAGDDGGWSFNDGTGLYTAEGVRVGSLVSSNKNIAHYRRRLRVNGTWRLSYDLYVDSGNSGYPADAVAVGFHNDPRGMGFVGSTTSSAGLAGNGLKNGWGVAWYVYSSSAKDKMGLLNAACTGFNYSEDYSAVPMRTKSLTHHVLEYDAVAKTLTVAMTNEAGTATWTKTFTDVDIPARVGDDYAWFTLSTAGGGAHTLADFRNLAFTYLDGDHDFLPETALLAGLKVQSGAGPVTLSTAETGLVFRVAETVEVGAGAALAVQASDRSATLAMGTVKLADGASLGGDGTAVVRPEAFDLAGDDLVIDGGVVEIASKKLLPSKTVLKLGSGAQIRLPFTGVLQLKDVERNGTALPHGVYTSATADWIVGPGAVSMEKGTLVIFR